MRKPIFCKAAKPASRTSTFAVLLLCTSALAGCATASRPPEISYDDAVPAALSANPPSPVRVVELPRPLPPPGQTNPVEPSRGTPEPAEPTALDNQPNAAARVQPVRAAFINSLPPSPTHP